MLFINRMVNGSGVGITVLSMAGHGQLVTMSESTDEDLLIGIDRVKPSIISIFPSQIASICRHSALEQFDLSSVSFVFTTGSGIHPTYERQIFDKLPNMFTLLVVSISFKVCCVQYNYTHNYN